MGERVGQVFVMGAILFSGLVVLAFLPIGPSLEAQGSSDLRSYFSQSFREVPKVFNSELSENRSIGNVKRGLYGFNRFVEERSTNKGITFKAYQLAVLPQKGEAVFINYRGSDLETDLCIDGSCTNTTVESKQYLNESFSSGTVSVKLVLPDSGDTYSFDTTTPRIVNWMRMEAARQTWENSYIG